MNRKINPLAFLLIMVSMCAVMYYIAFHEMRNENNELKLKLEKCKNN